MPERIQRRRVKGWRMPPNTRDVTRSTIFGNFSKDVEQFRRSFYEDNRPAQRWRAYCKAELKGKNLACWCPLPQPGEPDLCHAIIYLEFSNA